MVVGEASTKRGGPARFGAVVPAWAKLTLRLQVKGKRADGMHVLDAEMLTVDLADELSFERGVGVAFVDSVVGGLGLGELDWGPSNLVWRALARAGEKAAVRVVKRIPVGAGLGGGSADAAAVLRWAGISDLALAAELGSDVPFCLVGGRARVGGAGEAVVALPFEERAFVVLVPPLSVSTAAVYHAFDHVGPGRMEGHENELEHAAITVVPALAPWRDSLGDLVGKRPRLCGSGSAWFVEGSPSELGIEGRDHLVLRGVRAPLVPVRSVPPRAR
jgi:4-diphosphocytidyl-2-C-methyl-D-erythritol kinase